MLEPGDENKDDSEYLIPEIKVDPFSFEFKNLEYHEPGKNTGGKEAPTRGTDTGDMEPGIFTSARIISSAYAQACSSETPSSLDPPKNGLPGSSLGRVSNIVSTPTIAPNPASVSGDQGKP